MFEAEKEIALEYATTVERNAQYLLKTLEAVKDRLSEVAKYDDVKTKTAFIYQADDGVESMKKAALLISGEFSDFSAWSSGLKRALRRRGDHSNEFSILLSVTEGHISKTISECYEAIADGSQLISNALSAASTTTPFVKENES